MFSKKFTRTIGLLISIIALLTLELFWLNDVYRKEYKQFLTDVNEAFKLASQKEQTYRIPVNEIINPGDLTIQSCGKEEIRIIRQCPKPDTIIFNNFSEQSLETFIHHAFYELRESITPLNIYCLADLFAGVLQEKNILLSFTIEYLNNATGKVIETTAENSHSNAVPAYSIIENISANTSLRANLFFSKSIIFERMSGDIAISACLLVIALIGLCILMYSSPQTKQKTKDETPTISEKILELGKYHFYFEKNELSVFDKTIHLNKKENAILQTLCEKQGKVVERNFLLKEYWGNT
ncbi:MAG: winged helix-turn-helix domain-containing protein, partial [Prevotellaceae bacterium]|nr:winged helix-turn-helix domain-containing protein [Prevotellaceae bacterium]